MGSLSICLARQIWTLTPNQPYPANLMVGFYAIGDPLEPIRVDLDKELEGSHTVQGARYLLCPGSICF